MKKGCVLVAVAAISLASFGATYTVPSHYDEEKGMWIGDVVALTNIIATCSNWSTVYLEKGVYDVSFMTNSPMGTSTFQGPSLLAIKTGTYLYGKTGNRDDVTIKGSGKYRLLQHANGCIIRHITFVGGHAEGGSYPIGGAIYPTGSAIEVRNCAFLFNSSALHGGAVGGNHNDGSGDNFYNCYFYGNASFGGGYGGAAVGGTYTGCTFVSNTCNYAWGSGGAIFKGKLVDGCNVVSNLCQREGGGLAYCNGVRDSYIAFNATKGPNAPRAGGLYCCGTITNCVVEYNVAQSWGSGFADTSAYGCTLRCNAASRDTRDYSLSNCDIYSMAVSGAVLVDSCRIHHVSNSFDVVDNVAFGPSKLSISYPLSVRKVRNSLIDHCNMLGAGNPGLFYSDGKYNTLVENCTIADNNLHWVLRGYNSTNAVMTFSNSALARNLRYAEKMDLSGYESSYTCLTNCILGVTNLAQNAKMENSGLQVKGASWNPKFADDGEFPYEPKYTSALRGAGLVLDWMVDSTDLGGRPWLRDGKADVGCYACWLNPLATVLIVR